MSEQDKWQGPTETEPQTEVEAGTASEETSEADEDAADAAPAE